MMGVEIPADIDPSSPATLEHFEAKVEDLKSQGKKLPKAVILCNPNNPKGNHNRATCFCHLFASPKVWYFITCSGTGFIYPKETILAYCRFCQKYNMHLCAVYTLLISWQWPNWKLRTEYRTKSTHCPYTKTKVCLQIQVPSFPMYLRLKNKLYLQRIQIHRHSLLSCPLMSRRKHSVIRLEYMSFTGAIPDLFESAENTKAETDNPAACRKILDRMVCG